MQKLTSKSLLKTFRLTALLEGVSYLLFGITLPLKYVYEILTPNYYVGMAHGVLFVFYCIIGLCCAIYYKWDFRFSLKVFLASLIPLGTFYLDTKYLNKL